MMMWYVKISMEMTVAIKVIELSFPTWIRLNNVKGCSKTFKMQSSLLFLLLTLILTFIGIYLLSISSLSDVKRDEKIDQCLV